MYTYNIRRSHSNRFYITIEPPTQEIKVPNKEFF